MARPRSRRQRRAAADHSWAPFRAEERAVRPVPQGGGHALALAYANSYHIGMSSLGFQRTYELIHRRPGWRAERFFSDGAGMPLSVEADRPLNAFPAVAFSVSFEEDYVGLLQLLDRAGIPLRRENRHAFDPLVVMGGSCASINPLPMAAFVDVFALGAAENTWPELAAALEEEDGRQAALERLAERPGFFVPAVHDPEGQDPERATAGGGPLDLPGTKLDKLELTAEQMRQPGYLPSTVLVTPRTEFADKVLIEMSRGCPEKCRYCWATFGMGTFRWHPTDSILAAVEEARAVTDQVGFVATAVGDHPEVERILAEAGRLGFRSAVSSIRIPAVTEGVLAALHASGDRSITLAPETGSDRLRAKMGKPVTNRFLLEKVRLIFDAGFTQLKLYFILGLPDETMEDVDAIAELAAEVREIMLVAARKTGVMGHLHLGTNVLVPKPFTPWQREPMDRPASLNKKIVRLKKKVARLPNVSLGPMSVRQAIWQTYISKAGSDAADALLAAARGEPLSVLLRQHSDAIEREVFTRIDGHCRWHFMQQRNTSLPGMPAVAALR